MNVPKPKQNKHGGQYRWKNPGKTKNKRKRESPDFIVSLLGGNIHAISDGNAFRIAGWKSSSLTSP
jgi:hypothetical protein